MAFNRKFNKEQADQYSGFTPIPEGEYSVEITNSEEYTSRSTGKPSIKLEITIITGACSNRKVWQYIPDNQYTDSLVRQIMSSCGKPDPEMIHPGIFFHLRGKVKIAHEQYNGGISVKVKEWIPKDKTVDPAFGPGNNNDDSIPF